MCARDSQKTPITDYYQKNLEALICQNSQCRLCRFHHELAYYLKTLFKSYLAMFYCLEMKECGLKFTAAFLCLRLGDYN